MNQKIFTIDWASVPKHIIEGLESGKMRFSSSNGNVYWAQGSGGKGIAYQLPFVPSDAVSSEQLVTAAKALQTTTLAAATISTGIILGALVLQSVYLSKKIENVGRSIGLVAQDIRIQGILDLHSKSSEYFGTVQAAQQLISHPDLLEDVTPLIPEMINKLATLRNTQTQFIDLMIIEMEKASTTDTPSITEDQFMICLRFVIEIMDYVPAALWVERELCNFSHRYKLSETIRISGANQYVALLNRIQNWARSLYNQDALYNRPIAKSVLREKSRLNKLFTSSVNSMLLGRGKLAPNGETSKSTSSLLSELEKAQDHTSTHATT